MRISIIIVSLNGRDRIAMPLDALAKCDPAPFEVIVVDNGSTDGLSAEVKSKYPDVVLVRAPQNLGFAGGNNLGILNARGDILILLNDDTEPEADWLKPLQEAFEADPRLGVAGCQLLYPGGEKVQHLGGIIHANGLTDHTGWGSAPQREGEPGPLAIESEYVTGAAIAIRREVVGHIGLLDVGFWPIYFEETDFCCRARRAGFRIAVVPQSRVIHHESQTTGRMSAKFLLTYHRNRIRFLIKNRPWYEWHRVIKAEVRWLLIGGAGTDQLWPTAMAWAWLPFQLSEVARSKHPHR